MNMHRVSRLLGVVLVIAPLAAQTPQHAARINPTVVLNYPDLVRLEHQGDVVHLLAYSKLQFGLQGHIYYGRSANGGRSWPVLEQDLGGLWVEYFDIATDGARAVISMHDSGTGPHVLVSNDRGTTWSAPLLVAAQGVLSNGESQVHVNGTDVTVAWLASTPGGTAWAARSTNGGLTWNPTPVPLDAGLPAPNTPTHLRKVASGATIDLFWHHGGQTAQQRSTDGGLSWLPQARIVASAPYDEVCGDGNLLALTHGGSLERSSDGGTTWTTASGTGLANYDGIAARGQTLLAASTGGSSPNFTLHINVSHDGGLTWPALPFAIVSPTQMGGAEPFATSLGLFVRLIWQAGSVWGGVLHSADGGLTWRLPPGNAERGFWPGPTRNVSVTQVTPSGTWQGTAYYVYVHAGHTLHGQGSAGTGGVTPDLAGSGLPGPGLTFQLEVASARGGATGGLFVAFSDPVSQPLGTATLYLAQPIGPVLFVASGAPSAAGAGSASIAVQVPNTPAMSGIHMTSQAFVLDPGVAAGFAATRAIETWIR